jgi:hypothetical protein
VTQHSKTPGRRTAARWSLATLALFVSLLSGCGGRATLPAASDVAVLIVPLGVQTNICIPARPGATYGVVTDDLGLLYLQGLLPE